MKKLEKKYKSHLKQSVVFLDSILQCNQKEDAINYYKKSKKAFKLAEPILAFIDNDSYNYLNSPNLLKVEEEDATDIKIVKPTGFQVIEETLFEQKFLLDDVKFHVKKTKNRLSFLILNTDLKFQNYHILWIIRDAIARISLTEITGFDSPVLENALIESSYVYTSILEILDTYQNKFQDKFLYQSWKKEIIASQNSLQINFNDFNRYKFIKNHAHQQLKLIIETKQDWKVTFPYALAFNDDITSFFSAETFNLNFFADNIQDHTHEKARITLGKKIFNDTRLSDNNKMSCATCHHKDKAFTDGKKNFKNQKRNTPTLTYAALQQRFFYDGRTGNLEGQIVDVVKNSNEFHSNLENVVQVIKNDKYYLKVFDTIYNGKITDINIRNAIASYVRSLSLFNSKFDDNINNKRNDLTPQEEEGFNLFMGKAKCATCHFAPVFNGTIPPNFKESEFEAIGVPQDNNSNSVIDNDLGRYNVFKTNVRKHFFKTPTIRNIHKTAPYMHNGVYTTLDQVMDFYNNGGGAGLGLTSENQTLPVDSLKLSKSETENIILFMKSLDDKAL